MSETAEIKFKKFAPLIPLVASFSFFENEEDLTLYIILSGESATEIYTVIPYFKEDGKFGDFAEGMPCFSGTIKDKELSKLLFDEIMANKTGSVN